MNSRGFAFCKLPGAWYFEGPRDLNLVNSRGFALCVYIYIYIYTYISVIFSWFGRTTFLTCRDPDRIDDSWSFLQDGENPGFPPRDNLAWLSVRFSWFGHTTFLTCRDPITIDDSWCCWQDGENSCFTGGGAFCRCPGAWYFEGLRGLNVVNSRRFAFCRCPGAWYFEWLRGLNQVNSRGFVFYTYVHMYIHTYIHTRPSPPHSSTRTLHLPKVLRASPTLVWDSDQTMSMEKPWLVPLREESRSASVPSATAPLLQTSPHLTIGYSVESQTGYSHSQSQLWHHASYACHGCICLHISAHFRLFLEFSTLLVAIFGFLASQ